MKLFPILTFLFILPLQGEEKSPFDNWVFNFFEGTSESFCDVLGPDGEKLDEGAGSAITKIDRKNNISKSIHTVRFKHRKEKIKSVSTSKPKEKNVFLGESKNSNGVISTSTMTIIDEKNYKSVTKGPNGMVVNISAKLTDENTIESTQIMKDGDGNHLVTFKVTHKRAKKPKKKE